MKDKEILIYNAVIDIIEAQGFNSNIKISDIAKKAGIGKGTVYEYFKNKDEILAGSIMYLLQTSMKDILNDNMENNLKFKEELINHINKVLTVLSYNIGFHSLLVSQNVGCMLSEDMKNQIKAMVQEMRASHREIFNNIINKGICEGAISEDVEEFNIEVAKTTIMSSILEHIHKNKISNRTEEEFVNKLYNVVVKILS